MLEQLPRDIIQVIFRKSLTQTIGQLAKTSRFFKKEAYRFLYPAEWEDRFDTPVPFYVPIPLIFDQKKSSELTEWSHHQKERIASTRHFYASKQYLNFKESGYYFIHLSPTQIIHSKGFFPKRNIYRNFYESFMGIPPETISSYLYQTSTQNPEIQEVTNPFYGTLLPAEPKPINSEPSLQKNQADTTKKTKNTFSCNLF